MVQAIAPSPLQISQIEFAPGDRLRLTNVSWQQYKQILEGISWHRAARIAYDDGKLEIMIPTSGHEDDKEIISDLLKVLLEEQNKEFRALGSALFEQQATLKGIKPDQCFYIQNEAAIRGKRRIDISSAPPPDLVLEIDTATRTHLKTYEALKVPELWQFSESKLAIYVLHAGQYAEIKESLIFPGIPIKEVIPYCLEQSRKIGRNSVIKDFRGWVKAQS